MKDSVLRAHVVVKTLNLATSRRCFAEYGKEMYKTDPARAARLFFVISPIVLWRCRCRSHFLNSLLTNDVLSSLKRNQ